MSTLRLLGIASTEGCVLLMLLTHTPPKLLCALLLILLSFLTVRLFVGRFFRRTTTFFDFLFRWCLAVALIPWCSPSEGRQPAGFVAAS